MDKLSEQWKEFCELFSINYTSFYRTSTAEHGAKVQDIWKILELKGLIYKKPYVGKYCIGCESFKLDKELVAGKCPDHPTLELVNIEETNYFFKLSLFRETLLKWVSANPNFLLPADKTAELLNLLSASEDISISRTKEACPWGVEVPGDPNQTIYVWFDALLNYIIAAGYPDNLVWENVVQICGPDNLRFQAIIFQAFLEALNIPHTTTLLVHGTILDSQGRKQSKTTGNVIDPIDQLNKYGLDAVRYYALAGLNTYSDSSWSEEQLIQCFNSDICNDWGNTVSRVLHLISTKCNGEVLEVEEAFLTKLKADEAEVIKTWQEFQPKLALAKTNEIVKRASAYIDTEKPWKNANYHQVISNLYHLLVVVNNLYSPVLINGTKTISAGILNKSKVITFTKL